MENLKTASTNQTSNKSKIELQNIHFHILYKKEINYLSRVLLKRLGVSPENTELLGIIGMGTEKNNREVLNEWLRYNLEMAKNETKVTELPDIVAYLTKCLVGVIRDYDPAVINFQD